LSKKKGVVKKSKKRSSKSKSKNFSDRKSDFLGFPSGIKFLIFFSIANALLFVILALKFPYLVYFGFNLEGLYARFIMGISSLFYFLIVVGFILRKKWSIFLSVFWYLFNIVSSFFSLLFLDQSIFGILYDFVFYGLVFSTILNIFVVWYIISRWKFFFDLDFKHGLFDKIFINLLSGFMIVFFLVAVVMFFSLVSKSSSVISSYGSNLLSFVVAEDGFEYCSGVSDSDLCLLTFSVMRQDKISSVELVEICSKIRSPFYRYTCYEGLGVR